MIKTAVYYNKGVAIKYCNRPVCRNSEVLVKVLKVGLNPVDAKRLIGDKITIPDFLVSGYGVGFDFAGVVVDREASGFEKGELVFGTTSPGQASLQELIAAPVDQIARIPKHLSVEEAACLPLAGLTCVQAFRKFQLTAGAKVLIIGGSGGVGHLAIQIAKSYGCRVISIQSARNFSFAKKCGADVVLDYHDFDQLLNNLKELAPFDVIFDTVSDISNWTYPTVLHRFARSADNHSYITLGGSTLMWFKALVKRLIGWNFFESWHELFWVVFPSSAGYLEEVKHSGCKPEIEKILPFTEDGILEGFEALGSRRTRGKVVVNVSSVETP